MQSCSCCYAVIQSCLILCDPTDCSTPDLSVLHHLSKFAQVHVHCINDTIQPSHPQIHFSFCPQSFPGSGLFPVSQLFASAYQNNEVSTSASVLPTSTQGWFPLRLTSLISLLSKGLCSSAVQGTRDQIANIHCRETYGIPEKNLPLFHRLRQSAKTKP